MQPVGPTPGSQPPPYREQPRVATSSGLPVPANVRVLPPMPPQGMALPVEDPTPMRLPPIGSPGQDGERYPGR
jgi:hypothetical protein